MTKKFSPAGSRKASKEFDDIDYWDKLSDEEKEWLVDFVDEYYYNFDRKNGPMPKDKKSKRKRYQNDNARRRDIWNNFIRTRLPVEHIADDED